MHQCHVVCIWLRSLCLSAAQLGETVRENKLSDRQAGRVADRIAARITSNVYQVSFSVGGDPGAVTLPNLIQVINHLLAGQSPLVCVCWYSSRAVLAGCVLDGVLITCWVVCWCADVELL